MDGLSQSQTAEEESMRRIHKGRRGFGVGVRITNLFRLPISNRALYGTILFITILMATGFSNTFSRSLPICLRPSLAYPKHFLLKSQSCPLWSSSFSLCLHTLRKSTTNPRKLLPVTTVRSFSTASTVSGSPPKVSANEDINNNPLLKDFDFPPFDRIEAKHVRPAILAFLQQLGRELEKTVEPSWPKLVEPMEKINDRLAVVCGAVNHLNPVQDNPGYQ